MLWSMLVCCSEVISRRLIFWYMFCNSASTARPYQNPVAAAAKSSTFQQKYRRNYISGSSRAESVWTVDRLSASTFVFWIAL